MNNIWRDILEYITSKYNIKEKNDWSENDKEPLNKFKYSLEKKVKLSIIENPHIAEAFLGREKYYTDFLKSNRKGKEEILNKSTSRVKFTIDERTLIKHLLSESLPDHKKVKNMFSIYVYDTLYTQENIETSIHYDRIYMNRDKHTNEAKLLEFQNTSWWVYYYHYVEHSKRGLLGRAHLEIKEKNIIFLQNVPDETSSHFEGTLSLESTSQHLHLDLLSSPTKEKHLRITVFCGIGKVHSLLTGVYTNIYSTNAMVAGSIILHRIEKPEAEEVILESKTFNFEEEHHIPKPIIDFLKHREKNFIKTPSNKLSIGELEKWLKMKNR